MKLDPYYLRMYKENERGNAHTDNLLMLASIFGNKVERRLALMNWQRQKRLGYVDSKLNALAQLMIGPYYYQLIKLAESHKS